MSEMAESKLCLKEGLSTGLESIDKLLLGLRRGEVIQLSAEPYSDSAYFALFIAKCLAQGLDWAGRPINEGFSYATLFFKLTSMTHGVSRIDANGDKVIVDDAVSWDVDDVFSLARKGKESNGIALIVIDALHWLCPKRDGQELRVDDVLEIVKRLRHMAEELGVTMIVISSGSRLKCASRVAIFDVDMRLEHDPRQNTKVCISVRENHNGKLGRVEVAMTAGSFVEYVPDEVVNACVDAQYKKHNEDLKKCAVGVRLEKAIEIGHERLAEGKRREAAAWLRNVADDAEAISQSCCDSKKLIASAQYQLGVLYEIGTEVGKDLVDAVKWYYKAAENGHAMAQYKLGRYCQCGVVVVKDLDKAISWYRKAAEQGNSRALERLARCYVRGEGVERNLEEAEKLLKKAVASAKGKTEKACLQARYDSFVEMVLNGDDDSAYLWHRGQCSRE